MELVVSVNKKELDKYIPYTNSFIIGLKDFSVNYYELNIDEIKEILNNYQINLFVAINKNIFNDDLDLLKKYLRELSKLKIKGILFYDLCIVAINKELNLHLNLVYHQTHMVVNYNIVNFYNDLGVKYAYLSSEITESEMEEISNKTNSSLMALFIGHIIISHSKRKLVSNYYKHVKKDNKVIDNIIKENGKDNKYIIKENEIGTNILTYDILNGSKAFVNLKDKLDFGILDNNLIDDNLFIKILKLFKGNLDNKLHDNKFIQEVEELIGNYDGFFYTKTIYKVKK